MTGDTHDCGCGEAHSTSRRRFVQGCGAALAFAAAGTSIETVAAQSSIGNVADLLADMPDNWGRWGPDDGLGALNLLGSEEMFEGMNAAMKRGKKRIERFTLQTPLTGFAIDALVEEDTDFPTEDTGDPAFPGRLPARRDNVFDASEDTPELAVAGGMTFADDKFVTPLFLQGTTHVDALGHGWYGDQLYNGFDTATTHTSRTYPDFTASGCDGGDVDETFGLGKADISFAAQSGIAGRGVLLDVGRHQGGSDNRLPLDRTGTDDEAAITLEDLKETADAQGVEIEKRDILLVRTGAIERARDPDAEWDALGEPGLTYSDALVEWVHDMEFPYLGADNLAVEQITHEVGEGDLDDGREDLAGTYVLPLHGAFLRDLGITLNEVMDLSALAAQCADDGVYEFLFTAAPLYAEMSTGAPINPVVVKATGNGGGGEDDDEGDDGNGNGD